jgi:hypothetical protein
MLGGVIKFGSVFAFAGGESGEEEEEAVSRAVAVVEVVG